MAARVQSHGSLCLFNRTRQRVIADQVEIAQSFGARTRGLIGRRTLPAGFALVIQPCNGVHTLFMAFSIDVGYVDERGQVVRLLHEMKPWRLGPLLWQSAWIFELPAGTARATGTEVGDQIELRETR